MARELPGRLEVGEEDGGLPAGRLAQREHPLEHRLVAAGQPSREGVTEKGSLIVQRSDVCALRGRDAQVDVGHAGVPGQLGGLVLAELTLYDDHPIRSARSQLAGSTRHRSEHGLEVGIVGRYVMEHDGADCVPPPLLRLARDNEGDSMLVRLDDLRDA